MPSFLITLVSWASKRAGIGILNTDSGFHYLQDDYPALHQLPFSSYRGVALFERHIYLATSHSIRIYDCSNEPETPFFTLQQEIRYFDWSLLTGQPPYVGLVPILLSKKRNRILVANNSQCSVDALSLKGDFVKRYSLWDIAPDIFQLPEQFDLQFTYGQTRQLCETTDGSIYMTVANCSKSGNGKIIDLDSGELLLDGLQDPHGGIISHGLYFLQDVVQGPYGRTPDNGKLMAYNIKQNQKIGFDGLAWEATLKSDEDKKKSNPQQLRGIAVAGDKIYCGASFFGNPSVQQVPNRIVSFDIMTSRQLESFDLPDLVEFRHPQIFAMTLIPDDWQLPNPDKKLTFFLAGKQVVPQPYQPATEAEATPEKKEKKSSTTENSTGTQSTVLPGNNKTVPEKNNSSLDKARIQTNCKKTTNKAKKKKLVRGARSIFINHVSLCYLRTGNFLFSLNKKERTGREYWALRDISVSFYEGDTVGLIGRNGSGKSTLSMMISGALKPDKGKVITQGKVQLLALGIGFRPQLTGRENVMISGSILGMPRKKIKARMNEIEAFAELGDFFDEPIRTYSAGMKSRLGFAVSTAVQPDILILDEVMSTGDAAFRNKANKRMEEMRGRTKTVVVVSHSPAQIKALCSRVVWLEKGRVLMDGSIEDILPIYERFCKNPDQWLTEHPEIADLLI